ncbi:MAG: nuclear transport factor 2 family protein, partial [Gammaproteobacteria bacterium]
MRHLLALLTSLILLTPLARGAGSGAQEQAIARTLDAFHAAAAAADGERYFALFTAQAVFIGTDATERWTLEQFRDYALPLFARGTGWVYRPRERHITLADLPCACIAWFDELLDS